MGVCVLFSAFILGDAKDSPKGGHVETNALLLMSFVGESPLFWWKISNVRQ